MKKVIKAFFALSIILLMSLLTSQESFAQGDPIDDCNDPWWTTIHYPGGGGICDTNGNKCCGAD